MFDEPVGVNDCHTTGDFNGIINLLEHGAAPTENLRFDTTTGSSRRKANADAFENFAKTSGKGRGGMELIKRIGTDLNDFLYGECNFCLLFGFQPATKNCVRGLQSVYFGGRKDKFAGFESSKKAF